ncbi:NADH(P)-binding domain-containing protein [Purpureocillium lavendulum]|uniref:NADH(P)-binding domain-containing protein n=1 Tax=Purpureocillium lavendulum TaxID=1247861 RepID=A0AB34FCX9_9HYPO|nr:NADH(P)-binding domain-containing protein [Purpureocillium lavendulum]
MSTYAILGATGTTGSEITRLLLPRLDIQLNIYARSGDKLANTVPELTDAKNARTFIGQLSDAATMTACLRDTSVVFMAVGTNSNKPGTRVTQDACKAIANSLKALRAEKKTASAPYKPPTIVFLASTMTAAWSRENQPWLANRFVYNAGRYVYSDHVASFEYLEREVPWVPVIKASPGALVEDVASGFRLEPHGRSSETCSYKDLAAAMILMVEDQEKDWVGMDPGVFSLGKPRRDLLLLDKLPFHLIPGNIVAWLPWMYPVLHKLGLIH